MEEIERDEDGFPVASAAAAGSLWTDEFGVVWACEFNEWFDEYVWVTVGPTWFVIPREDGDEPVPDW